MSAYSLCWLRHRYIEAVRSGALAQIKHAKTARQLSVATMGERSQAARVEVRCADGYTSCTQLRARTNCVISRLRSIAQQTNR